MSKTNEVWVMLEFRETPFKNAFVVKPVGEKWRLLHPREGVFVCKCGDGANYAFRLPVGTEIRCIEVSRECHEFAHVVVPSTSIKIDFEGSVSPIERDEDVIISMIAMLDVLIVKAAIEEGIVNIQEGDGRD